MTVSECPECGLPLLDHDTAMCPTIAALRTERNELADKYGHAAGQYMIANVRAAKAEAERDELRAALRQMPTDEYLTGWRDAMQQMRLALTTKENTDD